MWPPILAKASLERAGLGCGRQCRPGLAMYGRTRPSLVKYAG